MQLSCDLLHTFQILPSMKTGICSSFLAAKSGLCPCFVSVHWYLTTILMWEKRFSYYAGSRNVKRMKKPEAIAARNVSVFGFLHCLKLLGTA